MHSLKEKKREREITFNDRHSPRPYRRQNRHHSLHNARIQFPLFRFSISVLCKPVVLVVVGFISPPLTRTAIVLRPLRSVRSLRDSRGPFFRRRKSGQLPQPPPANTNRRTFVTLSTLARKE